MFLRRILKHQGNIPPIRASYITKLTMSTAADDLKKPILALPSTADETVKCDINDTYKLKDLGPVGKSNEQFYKSQ
jgi:hypothetical protein